jgi:hypothetical protein
MTVIGDRRRADILAAIIEHKRTNGGNAPSVRWIMTELDYKTPSAVEHHLKILRSVGKVVKSWNNKWDVPGRWEPVAGGENGRDGAGE